MNDIKKLVIESAMNQVTVAKSPNKQADEKIFLRNGAVLMASRKGAYDTYYKTLRAMSEKNRATYNRDRVSLSMNIDFDKGEGPKFNKKPVSANAILDGVIEFYLNGSDIISIDEKKAPIDSVIKSIGEVIGAENKKINDHVQKALQYIKATFGVTHVDVEADNRRTTVDKETFFRISIRHKLNKWINEDGTFKF